MTRRPALPEFRLVLLSGTRLLQDKTPFDTPGTIVPIDTSGSAVSPITQPSAQPFDARGSRYSSPERIQRAVRLAQLHEENRKWHEREAALLAWHTTATWPCHTSLE